MIARPLFDYAQDLLREHNQGGVKKRSAYAEALHQHYGFGKFQHNQLLFKLQDLEKLKDEIKRLHGLDLRFPYPDAASRSDNAQTLRQEKTNALPVSNDFVLINALHALQLNSHRYPLSSINSLGQYLNHNEINSIEHNTIVLVENLTIMAALTQLILPPELQHALWVYRGDVKPQQSTNTAYHFFRNKKYSQHKLVCFADFDPEGLQIVASSGAGYWLAPEPSQWQSMLEIPLHGAEKEWHKQQQAKAWLQNHRALPGCFSAAYSTMQNQQSTFKQEHMLRHNIPLSLQKING